MVTKRYHPRKKRLTPIQQFLLVRQYFSGTKIANKQGRLHLYITLQPTPFSPNYPIEIIGSSYGKYDVWLIGNIQKIDDPNFPHKYEVDKKNNRVRLCLYHPSRNEWERDQEVYNTLIPWTCEWLYYYELWLDDGKWRGGGEHPKLDDRKIFKKEKIDK